MGRHAAIYIAASLRLFLNLLLFYKLFRSLLNKLASSYSQETEKASGR